MTEPTPPERGRHGPRPASGARQDPAPDFLLDLFADPLDPGYADAAAHRAEHGPRPAWRRQGALVLRTATLVATGFLLAVAYRHAVAAEPERSGAHAGLVDEVKAAQVRADRLQRRSDDLRSEVGRLQETALGGANPQLREIRQREAATGLATVTGDGVVVQLADPPTPIDPTTGKPTGADVSRVLDVDLQSVVNGLWSVGAEAIAVNGQRLTSTSTIRTAGSAILVDFRPVISPYDVAAIGPADVEERFNGGAGAAAMRALAKQYGLGFSSRARKGLTLPAAAADTPLRYAHPVGASTAGTPAATTGTPSTPSPGSSGSRGPR
jgi:uncharacterized protein YlxW (UPF0749 family)